MKVGVVIVTYNRFEKLKNTLKAYSQQQYKPSCIIVVDNNSSDETGVFLSNWEKNDEGFVKKNIRLNENIGGSGGFLVGENYALNYDLDWLMVGDDDAYPDPDYIDGLVSYVSSTSSDEISIICGRVLEKGKNVHRRIIKNKWTWDYLQDVPEKWYEKDCFEFDAAGYLGLLLNVKKLRKVGCIDGSFFIWADDVEHCFRLKNEGKIICVPRYTIIHDTENVPGVLSWKQYYGFRNQIYVTKKYFGMYFPIILFTSIVKSILCFLKRRSITEVKLRITSIIDGCRGKMGIHHTYKPGWKP